MGENCFVNAAEHLDRDDGNQSVLQYTAATHQTQDVRMPMHIPKFKPAEGCTDSSDFIVRCFVARLRSGIAVVKHDSSRWSKSRRRVLHVHSDGYSLTWKPAPGEPSSRKRPPRLDLASCREIRHAWTREPGTMLAGTPILRQKCDAANAHKSFSLIFPIRTVDITAMTSDQCTMLIAGFSALCFRLKEHNMPNSGEVWFRGAEEDHATASVTLTNVSV